MGQKQSSKTACAVCEKKKGDNEQEKYLSDFAWFQRVPHTLCQTHNIPHTHSHEDRFNLTTGQSAEGKSSSIKNPAPKSDKCEKTNAAVCKSDASGFSENNHGTVSDLTDQAMMGFIKTFDENNFQEEIGSNVSFVKFFAPWCGHCKRLEGVWKDLAAKFRDSQTIKIAEVNCSFAMGVCASNKVDGYPTLLLFKDGKRMEEYEGKRNVDDLMAFVNRFAK